ncbi:hypothetical protein [Pseudomonas sp. TCU-HL1]|uniref:hypothetical protein n=1 Tax=Pseudomonas sp. TCU-HL1 TaxID=1856685 RepID=UPI0008572AF8|nr:hypothetical protein [Pseudomonas sp. TCU-HL1]AOE84566.1 integrase [Pseudomonas sp. TCU-HL1]
MAKTQQERDQGTAERRQQAGEMELRHQVVEGTEAALAAIMEWHGFEQKAEAMQILIINTHALGPEFSAVAAATKPCPRTPAEDLRHRLRPGPSAMLDELAQWRGSTSLAVAVEHLIFETYLLGPEGSAHLVTTSEGKQLTEPMLRQRFEPARKRAVERATENGDPDLAEAILQFRFHDIRPKAASEIDSLEDASDLLGHTQQEITKRVYRRVGKVVNPVK